MAGEYFKRRIGDVTGSWPFSDGARPEHLDELVASRTRRLAREERATGQRVLLGIVVEPRDGMTRNAEHALETIRANVERDWTVRSVSATRERALGPVAELAELLGSRRAVLRAARKSGLVPGRPRDWLTWIVLGVVIVAAGVAVTLATKATAGAGTTGGLLVLIGALNYLPRLIQPSSGPVFGSDAMRRVEDTLADAPKDSDAEHEFLRALRGELARQESSRAIVIDDVGRLRERAQRLVRAYLKEPGARRGEELWVVFERGSKRSRAARRAKQKPGAALLTELAQDTPFRSWQCRQELLGSETKRRFIRTLEHDGPVLHSDSRMRLKYIGDIARGINDETAAHELEQHLADVDEGPCRAFALLALDAIVPEPALLSASDVTSVLRGGQMGPLPQLLKSWFPEGEQREGAVRAALRRAVEDLEPVFDEAEGRRRRRGEPAVAVIPAYADALSESYREVGRPHQLPPADDGHAFWALYWHRRMAAGEWSSLNAERLIIHIRAIRDPEELRERLGARTARTLGDAVLAAIDASLALCVTGLAGEPPDGDEDNSRPWEGSGLVDRALLLICGHTSSEDRRILDALMDKAWAAFMLTGRPSLLEVASSIAEERDLEPTPAGTLEHLYLETLPQAARGRAGLPPPTSSLREAVHDHAIARAAWFAEVVRPLIGRGRSEWLAGACAVSLTELTGVLERTIRRLELPGEGVAESLDYATLCVAMLALSRHARTTGTTALAGEQVRSALRIASRRRDERSDPAARRNFVLNGLLHELDAIDRGAERELAALHAMWHSLELYELADMAALAGQVFVPGTTDSGKGLADYLVGLDQTGERPINRVESELLVGIDRLDYNIASAGVPLLEGACVALDDDIGEVLSYELAKLMATQTFETDDEQPERLLAHTLDPPANWPRVLDVEDADVPRNLVPLLNCAKKPGSNVYAELTREADARRERIENPWYADEVKQVLEYAETGHRGAPDDPDELAALRARWRTRIWDPGMPPELARAREKNAMHAGQSPSGEGVDVVYVYDSQNAGANEMPQQYLNQYAKGTRERYAFVLRRMWKAVDGQESGLLDDAIQLITESAPSARMEGYVTLAWDVSKTLEQLGRAGSQEFAHALATMREGMAWTEMWLRPRTNLLIYDHLARWDHPNASAHRYRADRWRLEDERLEQEKLFLSYADRRYFEVFWYHFMRTPELPCDLPRDEIFAPCATLDGAVPSPIAFDSHRKPEALGGAFLKLGNYVFHTQAKQERTKEREQRNARAGLHAQAHRHIGSLYDLLLAQTTVAPALKELFEQQRERFEEL